MVSATDCDAYRDELEQEERALAASERAPFEGRVCDPGLWADTIGRRQQRIVELGALIVEYEAGL